ncbi:protein DpdD [Actinokineospora sp. NPDC004072]
MTEHDRAEAWDTFLASFFSTPNECRLDGTGETAEVVALAQRSWLREPPAPFFLPMKAQGWTYWYALCPDKDQRIWVRDLIRAHVGSWIRFDGQPLPGDSTTAVDGPVLDLLGPRGCAYRFFSARSASAEVNEGIQRLTRMLAARPHRKVRLTPPLGAVVGDFWDACASGAEDLAREGIEQLEQDHRLSRANRLFLRLQFHAAFEQWDELERLEQLPDLVRLDRPVLASDALARLAMARLPATADVAAFTGLMGRFGSLVPSVTAIRSAAGAQYYAYWSLASGAPVNDLVTRLLDAGWLEHARDREGLRSLLVVDPHRPRSEDVEADPAALRAAVAERRFDAAVDMLAAMAPAADLVPDLVNLLVETFHPQVIDLFKQWKQALGELPVEGALADRVVGDKRIIEESADGFGEAVAHAFSLSTARERAHALDTVRSQIIPRLMRPGALLDAIGPVRATSQDLSDDSVSELVDLLLDIERDLFSAAQDIPGIQELRLLTVDVWAAGDQSGDRRRATRLLDAVARALDCGMSPKAYGDLVDALDAGWSPFLTDADLPMCLETIEVLAASKPDTDTGLRAFAARTLSRIGHHNARRIDSAWLDTAIALADEFGLDLTGIAADRDGAQGGAATLRLPQGTFVAIYSRMEPAARRAASILAQRYGSIRIDTFATKVATDPLRSAAKNADLVVIADKAAAHAATDAVKAARAGKPLVYARGKGTASLLQAVNSGLEALYSG